MKEQEILESNKLIAKFLGSKYINDAPNEYPDGYYYQPENSEIDCPTGLPKNWSFHDSWDWLMPVVEKIENLDDASTIITIQDDTCTIWGGEFEFVVNEYSKLKSVYIGIVKFIEWYSKNN